MRCEANRGAALMVADVILVAGLMCEVSDVTTECRAESSVGGGTAVTKGSGGPYSVRDVINE